MKVEYTEELEELVMLYAECIISLIKASLNGPLHSYYRISSRWALDKECGKRTQNPTSFYTLHAIFKNCLYGDWHLEQMPFWLLKIKAFGRMVQINYIPQLKH